MYDIKYYLMKILFKFLYVHPSVIVCKMGLFLWQEEGKEREEEGKEGKRGKKLQEKKIEKHSLP